MLFSRATAATLRTFCIEATAAEDIGFCGEKPEISEMDLNPVFLYPDGYTVVDARIILGEAVARSRQLRRRQSWTFTTSSTLEASPSSEPQELRESWAGTSSPIWSAHNFKGKLYPINPRAEEIHGIKAYPRISAVPEASGCSHHPRIGGHDPRGSGGVLRMRRALYSSRVSRLCRDGRCGQEDRGADEGDCR